MSAGQNRAREIAFEPTINQYRGRTTPEMRIPDLAFSDHSR